MDGTFIAGTSSIRDVMLVLQTASTNLAVAVDGSGRLLGVVSDGDLRRALLGGAGLDDDIDPYIMRDPVSVAPLESRAGVVDLMQARGIAAVPIVDENRICVGIHTLRQMLGKVPRSNAALVMAGGMGSRLLPADSPIPKPMVKVAGRPILERIVNHLVGYGITNIVISVGFRAEVIEDYFGSGDRYGCLLRYVREDPSAGRGTAGALSELPSLIPDLDSTLLVLNGDLVTQANLDDLLACHERSQSDLTIATHVYSHQVPFGVIEPTAEGLVRKVVEKPTLRELVSAGIYALKPSVLTLVPPAGAFHMTDVVDRCLESGRRVGYWQIDDDWIDIGRPSDLAAARGLDS